MGLIPGLGRSPGGEHGNPLQYSCLENPMDRGVWGAAVHGVAKTRTRLKRLQTHTAVQQSAEALPLTGPVDALYPPDLSFTHSLLHWTAVMMDVS